MLERTAPLTALLSGKHPSPPSPLFGEKIRTDSETLPLVWPACQQKPQSGACVYYINPLLILPAHSTIPGQGCWNWMCAPSELNSAPGLQQSREPIPPSHPPSPSLSLSLSHTHTPLAPTPFHFLTSSASLPNGLLEKLRASSLQQLSEDSLSSLLIERHPPLQPLDISP